jgi:hypothetical protein
MANNIVALWLSTHVFPVVLLTAEMISENG